MLCTIIGVGPGLGASLANRFMVGGYDVALVSRDAERLQTVVDDLVDPSRARGFAADAGDESALRTALVDAEQWGGDTQVLIYNASRMVSDRIDEIGANDLLESMHVNVGGALTAIQHVLPSMKTAGRGTILLTGGGLALEPYPEWATLAAGKAAIRSLALNLHKQLLPSGIHVAVVAVAGIVGAGGLFDPDRIADQYWRLHRQPVASAQRELVYLPESADPFYNDPSARHRDLSEPIVPRPLTD